jgi:hypothetical protein
MTNDNPQKRKVIPVTIGLYEDKQKQSIALMYQIEELLKKGKPVPPKLITDLLECYQLNPHLVKYPERIMEILELCMERFGEDKFYNISGYKIPTANQVKAGAEKRQYYDLWKMLNVVIFHLYLEIQYDRTKERKSIIAPIINSLLLKYRETYLNPVHKKKLSVYRCRVLTGFITHCIVKITDDKDASNHDFQDKIRNDIPELKKRKSPKKT